MKLFLTVVILSLAYTQSVLSANLACGGTSATKTITIESPASPPTECTYTIKPTNTRICQLRVVLQEFDLAPPTAIGNGYPTCRHDIFGASGFRICGVNSNQHFYVTSTHAKPVTFSLLLANRVTNQNLSPAKWKITITQLECPTGILGRSDLTNVVDDQSSDLTVHRTATAMPDGYYLAPIGCLQYFPDAHGIVESFNFNNGIGPYYSDFEYAICFGRGENDTMVRLTTDYFKMGIGKSDGSGFDTDCHSHELDADLKEDYLFLPFATTAEGRRGTYFCGTSLAKGHVDVKAPGPFVINVASNDHYNAETDIGFKFSYEIL